ncbi:hypothetical protein ATANTOWER_027813 [Ataeniobius toweri]|uniref:Uncharacterized protein n=1 Tax=Ataeniobius toweri TaxID=208326 RepID=A0ABU7A3X3_9TELE|nr:hypothetical protein [Ataeniobius toweri]
MDSKGRRGTNGSVQRSSIKRSTSSGSQRSTPNLTRGQGRRTGTFPGGLAPSAIVEGGGPMVWFGSLLKKQSMPFVCLAETPSDCSRDR